MNATKSERANDNPRAPYEAPAIEQSATFERLQLSCTNQFGEESCDEQGASPNS